MSDCESFRELLSMRLDGELPDESRPALELHQAGCIACREWETEVRAADAAARDAGGLAMPDGFAGRVRRRAGWRQASMRIVRYGAAVAAGALLGVLATLASRPEPARTLDAETAADELGKHLHASQLLFRYAAMLPGERPAGEAALVQSELQSTALSERTARLLDAPLAPEARQYVEAVRKALAAIQAALAQDDPVRAVEAIRSEAAALGLPELLARVRASTGVAPRPIPVMVRPAAPTDAAAALFAQGRAHLFAGNYDQAAALLQSVEEGPYRDDAMFWYAAARERQGRHGEALRVLLMGASARWRDRETASRVKEIAARAGAVIAGRKADDLSVDDIERMLRQPVTVMVLDSGSGVPVMIVKPGTPPEAAMISAMPGVQVERKDGSLWMVVDVRKLPMDPQLIERIRTLQPHFQVGQ
jgi:hypothetical protein